jgi:ABC-type branched-subunit amino acid transport system permease subunit
LSTLSGQAGTTSMKHALIVGLGFFLVALVLTLVSISLNLSNTAFEVALS